MNLGSRQPDWVDELIGLLMPHDPEDLDAEIDSLLASMDAGKYLLDDDTAAVLIGSLDAEIAELLRRRGAS